MSGDNPRATPEPDADNPTLMHQPPPAALDETRAPANTPDVPTQVHSGPPTNALAGAPATPLGMLRPAEGPGELGRLGSYRVFEVMGAGGMGFVYRAEDCHLQRPVALKVLKPHLAQDDDARQRFLREARAAAALKNDHVVTIYQVGEDQGVPYLAMEFLEGEGLDHWLKRGGRPSLADVLRVGREIATGLDAAHRRGLIHRDIKPANVWLERTAGAAEPGRVKILDFGLARAIADDVRLTQSGTVLGTPTYMSPEQARGLSVDARSDLFSLGCVLYYLCTGRLPFRGETTIAVLTALAVDTPEPVRDLNPTVPPALAALISRLLAKAPDERPPTASAVVTELQAIEQATRFEQWMAPPSDETAGAPTRRVADPSTQRPAPAAATGPVPAAAPPPANPLLEELLRRARAGRRRALIVTLVFLALVGAAIWFFGPMAYRFANNQGLIVVRTDLPGAVMIIQDETGREVARGPAGAMPVKAGTWTVHVLVPDHGGAAIPVDSRAVTLTRGGTQTIDLRAPPPPR